MAPLMVSISGVRGVNGLTFTPSLVSTYVSAFASLYASHKSKACPHPVVVVGRDSRVSGSWATDIACGTLGSFGFKVLDIGIVPTPTVQYIVQQENAVAGLVITSSHNPVAWNGLKFIDGDGLFLSPQRCLDLFAIAKKPEPEPDQIQGEATLAFAPRVIDHTANSRHVKGICDLDFVPVEKIKAKAFKVALDTVNGAGGPIMRTLLETLGCTVVPLNLETTGVFAHTPEPVPENLGDLCALVKSSGADFGIATDPDVDRCVLIDGSGVPLGEEYTLALAVAYMVGTVGRRGPVVMNLSTSKVIKDFCSDFEGCPVLTTPVGEIHVAKKMQACGSVIGGEGNGGVMLPDLHIGRDAPVAAALVLSHLATLDFKDEKAKASGGVLAAAKAALPQYSIVKLKAPLEGLSGDPNDVLKAIETLYLEKGKELGITVNDCDGIRLDGPTWWVHLRKSNTEPIIRVIGEARGDVSESNRVCGAFMRMVSGADEISYHEF